MLGPGLPWKVAPSEARSARARGERSEPQRGGARDELLRPPARSIPRRAGCQPPAGRRRKGPLSGIQAVSISHRRDSRALPVSTRPTCDQHRGPNPGSRVWPYDGYPRRPMSRVRENQGLDPASPTLAAGGDISRRRHTAWSAISTRPSDGHTGRIAGEEPTVLEAEPTQLRHVIASVADAVRQLRPSRGPEPAGADGVALAGRGLSPAHCVLIDDHVASHSGPPLQLFRDQGPRVS